MSHHLFCLTIDTDPDGLSGKNLDRSRLEWFGLEQAFAVSGELGSGICGDVGSVPVTWFVRADGQLRTRLGNCAYLLERYARQWQQESDAGNELGWHPHLYRQGRSDAEVHLIADPAEACDELEGIWEDLRVIAFAPKAFRNGEAWHCPETLDTVERLGLRYDSSAVPGRRGTSGHPMDWMGTPNKPFFPSSEDIRRPGAARRLLELPMNTWCVRAPWDAQARPRYMNPAIHRELFVRALAPWRKSVCAGTAPLYVWVLIMHPDEIMAADKRDGLISHSRQVVYRNLESLAEAVQECGHTWEFTTLSAAAQRWLREEAS